MNSPGWMHQSSSHPPYPLKAVRHLRLVYLKGPMRESWAGAETCHSCSYRIPFNVGHLSHWTVPSLCQKEGAQPQPQSEFMKMRNLRKLTHNSWAQQRECAWGVQLIFLLIRSPYLVLRVELTWDPALPVQRESISAIRDSWAKTTKQKQFTQHPASELLPAIPPNTESICQSEVWTSTSLVIT